MPKDLDKHHRLSVFSPWKRILKCCPSVFLVWKRILKCCAKVSTVADVILCGPLIAGAFPQLQAWRAMDSDGAVIEAMKHILWLIYVLLHQDDVVY